MPSYSELRDVDKSLVDEIYALARSRGHRWCRGIFARDSRVCL